MSTVLVGRLYRFNAGHRLFHPERDDAWNFDVFGKCSFAGGHGHNYELEIVVRGTPDRLTGRVLPLAALDAIVDEHVIEPLDHRNLNDVLALVDGPAPTTEVLMLEIWRRLVGRIPPPVSLHRVAVSETDKNLFELEARASTALNPRG